MQIGETSLRAYPINSARKKNKKQKNKKTKKKKKTKTEQKQKNTKNKNKKRAYPSNVSKLRKKLI